eukprot:4439537-Ditylum_brightwellii.AAC.1
MSELDKDIDELNILINKGNDQVYNQILASKIEGSLPKQLGDLEGELGLEKSSKPPLKRIACIKKKTDILIVKLEDQVVEVQQVDKADKMNQLEEELMCSKISGMHLAAPTLALSAWVPTRPHCRHNFCFITARFTMTMGNRENISVSRVGW